MTKKELLLEALKSGETLTLSQIRARFSANDPYDLVRRIRREGYAVYRNRTVNSKNQIRFKYRLGQPSRALIAAAYDAQVALNR